MSSILVATSQVVDGNMYRPTEPTSDVVFEHRKNWLAQHGLSVNNASRVYITYDKTDFCQYREVDIHEKGKGMHDALIEPADALITTDPGHILFLPVADCVATVLYDPVKRVLMLSHLGRHSLEQDGGFKSVQYLVDRYGSNPADIHIWLSPTPGKESYKIHALENKGMKEVTFEQLARAGIAPEHITDNPADTATDPRYYSHSSFLKGQKKEDGRFATIAVMQ